MKRIRQIHFYLGVFFAPTILFYCFTGALQTFQLHEAHQGYVPFEWVVRICRVHKDQTSELPTPPKRVQRPDEPENLAPKEDSESSQTRRKPHISLPLKWFVLVMSLGLSATASLGIYMAFTYNRDIRIIWSLLIIGALLPIGLLYL